MRVGEKLQDKVTLLSLKALLAYDKLYYFFSFKKCDNLWR